MNLTKRDFIAAYIRRLMDLRNGFFKDFQSEIQAPIVIEINNFKKVNSCLFDSIQYLLDEQEKESK